MRPDRDVPRPADAPRLTIGAMARATGCRVQTIRYYEEIGLLPKPVRSQGNQRHYRPADADRLSFIRHCRELGFPLDDIRELLGLADEPARPCAAVDAIAQTHLRQIEERITRLLALKEELNRMIGQCEGGRIANCRIIQALAGASGGPTLSDPPGASDTPEGQAGKSVDSGCCIGLDGGSVSD